jgi:DNA-binding CsgD family transcriptional regulator
MAESCLNSQVSASIVKTICESDTSAWCFLPAQESTPKYCSRPFRDLWQLTAAPDAPFGFPLHQFEEAFLRTNVRADEFFAEVRQQRFEMPHRIRILRDDGVTIHATVTCVLSNTVGSEAAEITGWLIRFHVQSPLSSIEVLLDEVYKAQKKLEVLSNREREILELVYEGRTNKAISIVTGISEKTVEKHRARISMKLGLTSSTMMIRVITIARMLPERIPSPARESADTHQLMASLQSSTSVRMKPPAA